MTDDELMKKAIRQENAKHRLLIAIAEAVVEMIDTSEHMPPAMAKRIADLAEELKAASKP